PAPRTPAPAPSTTAPAPSTTPPAPRTTIPPTTPPVPGTPPAGSNRIGDKVWHDLDGDGALDAGEPGLPGVAVTVTWLGPDRERGGGDDVVMQVAVTDGNGMYLVTGLPDGRFSVDVTGGVPAGKRITFDPQGTSNPDGRSTVTVSGGRQNIDQDFGYVGTAPPPTTPRLGSIGDMIFQDTNGDGAMGDPADEPGLSGVDVVLTGAGPDGVFGTGDDLIRFATTDQNGKYLFSDLAPGDYHVEVGGVFALPNSSNTADPDGVNDSKTQISLAPGEDVRNADFGYQPAPPTFGGIQGNIYLDSNANGQQDAGEALLAGVTVTLTGPGPDGQLGTADDVVRTTVTNADGSYFFGDLPQDEYRVTVTAGLPAGATNTEDPDGVSDSTTLVFSPPRSVFTGLDFGYTTPSTPGSTVPGTPTTVPGTPTTVPGTPTTSVVVDPTPPPGVPTGGLTGLVALDSRNSAGACATAGAGIGVRVRDANGTVVATTATNPGGRWVVGNLVPGVYTVELVPHTFPSGVVVVLDSDGVRDGRVVVTVRANAVTEVGCFGLAPGTTQDRKDPGSPALPATGSPTDAMIPIAFALVLAGVVLTLARRRPDETS
ncbi:MAG: hypothetical protein HKN44_15635, partial [Ilumatobacter sp.]|nr:hypothetical protein [Ilumatobacter sp.]